MTKKLTIGFLISLCLLSGCTKTDNIDGTTSTNTEHLTRNILDADGKIIANIDADIIYPSIKDIPVATLKTYEFTNDDIKRIATTIYGDSDYYKLPEVSEYSASALNEAITLYNEKLDDLNQLYNENKIGLNSDYYNYHLIDYANQISEYTYYLAKAPTEVDTAPTLEFYDVSLDTWTASYNEEFMAEEFTFISSNIMQKCNLTGTYNAMPCIIEFFSTSDLYINMNADNTPVWKDYTYAEISFDDSYDNYYEYYDSNNPNLENECILSKDQAIELCDNIVTDFQLSNMEVLDIYNIPVKAHKISSMGHQYDEYIEKGYCGYEISYGKSINSANTNMVTYNGVVDMFYGVTEDELANVSDPESLTFVVMDCGIISISYTAPTVLEDISSTNTAILDFDTVLNLADVYFPNIYADIKGTGYQHEFDITRIQFGLTRITNDTDNSDFSLVPVWTFYEDGNFNPILTINAIDGSSLNACTGTVLE